MYNRARGGGGAGEGLQPPHFFGNFKELLRKRCFQPPHFKSLFSPPTFKVAPRALYKNVWDHSYQLPSKLLFSWQSTLFTFCIAFIWTMSWLWLSLLAWSRAFLSRRNYSWTGYHKSFSNLNFRFKAPVHTPLSVVRTSRNDTRKQVVCGKYVVLAVWLVSGIYNVLWTFDWTNKLLL